MFRRVFALVLLLAVASLGVLAVSAQQDMTTIKVEVAEDGNRFIFSQERLFEDGMPQYGSAFVTQGFIYPEGTLNGGNGVMPDGSAEFPDLVMGEWTCYGWMIGDGAHTTTGIWVVSTQVYQFNEAHGGDMLITDGFELVDFDVPLSRSITGGTGSYTAVKGEQIQTLMGFTETMGVNLSLEFQLNP